MKLTIINHYVRKVEFGTQNGFTNGVLTIDKKAAITFLMEKEPHLTHVDIVIANPGEDTRIVPVVETIEPRRREDGRALFPGVTGPVSSAGTGVLHAMKGCCVTVVAKERGSFGDGVIDMSGAGARHTYWSRLINICLVGDTDELFEREEQQKCNRALRWAGHLFAEYLGNLIPESASDLNVNDAGSEEYAFEPITERDYAENPLPKVVLVMQAQSQMEAPGYNDLIYGWDMNKYLPTLISPNEVLDGALISGSFMPASSKWSTYEMQNFPIIKEMFCEDGKSFHFIGVILSMLNVSMVQKERAAQMVTNMARNLGADYAIVTEEGYGNPDADYVMVQSMLEAAGIPVVGISNECTGRDGFSQPLMTLDKSLNALVSTGNVSELIVLPPVKKIIGDLNALWRDGMSGSWENDEKLGPSVREDGSVIMEGNNWFCGDHISGLSTKTVTEF